MRTMTEYPVKSVKSCWLGPLRQAGQIPGRLITAQKTKTHCDKQKTDESMRRAP